MKNTNDLRVARTYARLRQALIDLLWDKSFDEITVSDICEKADCRRATFYTHFKDKLDFMRHVIKSVHKEIGAQIQANAKTPYPTSEYFMQYVDIGIKLILSNYNLYEKLMSSRDFPVMCAMISECTAESLAENIKAAQDLGLTLPADAGVTATFVNAGITYTVLDWLRKRPPPDPSPYDELTKILSKLFDNNI